MPGETERPPATRSPDEVSLRDYLEGRIDAVDHAIRRELDLVRSMLQERYETQSKAVDAALAAAEKALDVRAANLQTEFHEHLIQYRHEVTLAFESSDRAISKAEAATERRFESVNEFRAQLNQQAGAFLTRAEYDAAHLALAAKVDEEAKHNAQRLGRAEYDSAHQALITKVEDEAKRNAERFAEINRRLDLNQGKSAGVGASWAALLGVASLIGTAIAIIVFFANR